MIDFVEIVVFEIIVFFFDKLVEVLLINLLWVFVFFVIKDVLCFFFFMVFYFVIV